MGGGSGGGGNGGRSGGGGSGDLADNQQPGEVFRAARQAEREPRAGDNGFTAALRKEYGGGNKGVNVSIEQLRGGDTRMTHINGTILIKESGATVQGSRGKIYSYSEKNVIKAMEHWESLAGIK